METNPIDGVGRREDPAESNSAQNLFFSQMWKTGGQAATSFLQSQGVSSLIGLGLALGRKQENDSSEDDTSQTEDEAFVAYGSRGIVVFNSALSRDGASQDVTVHLDLYKGIVRIYDGSRKQKFKCTDLINLIRGSECTIQMESKKSLATGPKIFRFAVRELAYQFQQYIEYIQDCGDVLRRAFNDIDRSRIGEINASSLAAAMSTQDIDFTDADLESMLRLSAQSRFDFSDFFHVLLGIPVYSLYTCLAEWIHKAQTSSQIHVPSEECDGHDTLKSEQIKGLESDSVELRSDGMTNVHFGDKNAESSALSEVISFSDEPEAEAVNSSSPVASSSRPNARRFMSAPSESDVAEITVGTVPGETVANVIPRVKWYIGAAGYGSSGLRGSQDVPSYHPFVFGSMTITNYRITLASARKHATTSCKYHVPPFFDLMSIPLNTVHKLTLITSSVSQQKCSIRIHTKDLRVVRVHFMKPGHGLQYVEMLLHMLQRLCFSGVRAHLFAYRYLNTFNFDGWALSDVRCDYSRMGLDNNKDWQILDNSKFDYVETYPPYLVLPAALSHDNIKLAAVFRSKARLPVVTYCDHVSGCVLLRSAQPLVGIIKQTSAADQLLLNYCRLSGTFNRENDQRHDPTFYILDARGHIAATVNMAAGKGTEDVTTYVNTELEFCNIENIHVMRSSFAAVGDVFCPPLVGSSAHASSGADSNFYIRLDDSGWTKHCRFLLCAAVKAAERLRLNQCSVLVHCSDGWDRTAQICSLTQIILDPFYRTLKGFCLLVEKEWCAFGYKFQDRCGHAEGPTHLADERSPVFVQWLDALYQLVSQTPSAFEYTDALLVFVADHVHSGLFGNFLGNCEKQRVETLNVRQATQSIWSYVLHHEAQFKNSSYTFYVKPLWPRLLLRDIRIWERFFCRWDINSHPHHVTGVEWHDDWGNSYETMSTEYSV